MGPYCRGARQKGKRTSVQGYESLLSCTELGGGNRVADIVADRMRGDDFLYTLCSELQSNNY